jgi:hypothetical protein
MKKKATVTMRNVGKRKEPSPEALERFINLYIELVKDNEQKKDTP